MIPALIEAALRALLVALTVWAGLRLCRMSNVLAQKAAWALVLAAAGAMPLLMRWQFLPPSASVRLAVPLWQHAPALPPSQALSPLSNPSFASQPRLSVPLEPDSAIGDRFPAPTISKSEFNPDHIVPAHAQPASAPLEFRSIFSGVSRWGASLSHLRATQIAAVLYLGVLLCLLLRMTWGLAAALRMWLAAEPVAPAAEPGLGLRLRSSSAIFSPVTIGSGVILPADYTEWEAEKLRIVLAHERSHVRQGDFYLQILAGVYAAVFWFSPLGWWLKHKLSDLGEAISDRAGLEEAASRVSYAQVLLEFAALPRPTAIGVAMARSSNLSQRIERLLNESTFRQAFTGSRRRILFAFLLVPIALFAGTALIRVEAAASGQAAPPPTPPVAPQSAEAPSVPPPAADLPPSVPQVPTPPTEAVPAPDVAPVPPVPPSPAEYREIHDSADEQAATAEDAQDDTTDTNKNQNGKHFVHNSKGHGYAYSYSSNGDSWALVTDSTKGVRFSGDWNDDTRDTIKKVRTLANGKFLWFTRNGKSYFITDSAVLDQVEAMQKPMEELGRQQELLGQKQEQLGRQQEALGEKQEQASIPTPDISREMARLNEAVAKLDAKKGSTVTQEELADIEGKIGDIQGRLGELQGEVGAKQGEFGAMQGKLGEQQGKLGAEQGRLGAEQGKRSAEADQKVKSIIDQSLRDGKAKPVQ